MIEEPEDEGPFFEEDEEPPPHPTLGLTPEQYAVERQLDIARTTSLQALSFALQSAGPLAPTQEIVDRAEAFRVFLSPPRRN